MKKLSDYVVSLPPVHAGVRNWARHLRRHGCAPVKIKNPDRFLNSSPRKRAADDRWLEAITRRFTFEMTDVDGGMLKRKEATNV